MGFTKLIGVRQNMIADKGGRGGKPISDFWLTRGGGGVWTPPFLADIICEQPLTNIIKIICFVQKLRFGLDIATPRKDNFIFI